MRRTGFWLTLVLLTGVLTACPRSEDATGALQVDILGLPAGTGAAVSVSGPGFTRQLTQSETLTGLAVGRYTVRAGAVGGYTASVSGSPATVSAGATARVSVAYSGSGVGAGGSISGTVSIVGTAETGASAAPFVPGEVIVKFKPGVRAQAVGALERLRDLPLEGVGLYRMAAELRAQSTDLDTDTLRLIAQLSARGDVVYAHPNYLLEAYAEPNDPRYAEQWHLRAVNLPAAWEQTTGSADVTVAVIDSGVAPAHPDLTGKLAAGYDFVSGAQSGDGDGRDGDPTDPGGDFHGSHVAGTVAAATDNGVGVAGVSWGSRILPVRVLGSGSGDLADAVDGILWSVGESVPGVPVNPDPADVLNLSLGGPFPCSSPRAQVLQDAFDRANEAGAVVVVAAGNDGADASNSTPASCGGVIVVGATTLADTRAPYSNYGARIDVMAPGGDLSGDGDVNGYPDGVLSTVQNPAGEADYAYFEGTSMASPHVAGVVALMKSVRPTLSGAEARDILKSTARPITDPLCAVGCGSGLIDAAAALEALETPAAPDFALSLSPATVSLAAGASVSTEVLVSRSGGFSGEVVFSVSGSPGGLSASFTPSATSGDSTRLTLSASTGLTGEYTLKVQGVGDGLSKTVPLSVVIEGDEPDLDIAGSYVFACPTTARDCDVGKLPAVRIETGGSSAAYTIPDVPAGDYNVIGWNDLNTNAQVDNGEPIGAFPTINAPSVVNPPASGVDFTLVPALGTQIIQGSLKGQ